MSGKKAQFLRWHEEKVRANYVFNLKREMEAYCISDVKLLKAGCEKFQSEFESHADFNPMEKCITIASSCNRFWQKKLLQPNTIAVEPPRGWHGAQTNTSVVARQWLARSNTSRSHLYSYKRWRGSNLHTCSEFLGRRV